MEVKAYGKKRSAVTPTVLQLSLSINIVLILALLIISSTTSDKNIASNPRKQELKEIQTAWHGGHPADDKSGSCWCGSEDKYCMCTPNLAIDLIITSSGANSHQTKKKAGDVWLVRRKDTNQLATMGGFVDVNETVEDAVKRELMEEMSLTLNTPPTLVGLYSDPRRDNRRRTASAVFAVSVSADVRPRAGDDAKEVVKISMDDIENHTYFADHRTILLDYRSILRGEVDKHRSSRGDFADDIHRSTCAALFSTA